MSWWLIIPVYVIGALGAFRYLVLMFQNEADETLAVYKPRKRTSWDDAYMRPPQIKPSGRWQDVPDVPLFMFFGIGFWFIWVTGWLISRFAKAMYWLAYKGLFPRGVKSKFAKEQGLQAQIEAKDRELAQMADNIKRLSREADLRIPEGL